MPADWDEMERRAKKKLQRKAAEKQRQQDLADDEERLNRTVRREIKALKSEGLIKPLEIPKGITGQMTVNDAREAFQAATSFNSELDRDFKNEISRANEKISDIRETIEAVGNAVEEARSVLSAGKEVLENIHNYFTDLVGTLASNHLPTDQAQIIADIAEECQLLVMAPDPLTDALRGRCGSVLSLLDEFDETAGDVTEAATTAFDKIEELAGMISEYAS